MSSNVYIGSQPIYQQYVGNTFGGVLYGYQVESEQFFEATGITNIDLKNSINDFVVNLKKDSLWDKMVQILPFVSDSTSNLDIFKYNLKDVNSYSASLNAGTGSSDLNGYRANDSGDWTTSNWINTHIVPNELFYDDIHVSIYTNSTGSTGDVYDFGSFFKNSQAAQFYTYMVTGRNKSGGDTQKIFSPDGSLSIITTSPDASGSFVGSWIDTPSGNDVFYRVNKTSIGEGVESPDRIGTIEAYFAANHFKDDTTSSEYAANISNKQYQCFTIGYGLTTSEMDLLTDHIQTFQENIDTALGTTRAV